MHKNTPSTFDPNTLPGTRESETLAQSEERVLGQVLTDIDNKIGPNSDVGTAMDVEILSAEDPAWAKTSSAAVEAELAKTSK